MNKSFKRKLNDEASTSTNAANKQQKPNDGDVLPITHKQLANMLRDLPMSDLLKIVKNDKCSLPAVRIIFKEKHLNESGEFYLTNKCVSSLSKTSIKKKITKMFRADIEHLHLMYHTEYRPFNHILEKIVEDYLKESLLRMRVENVGREALATITKPFANISILYLERGTICDGFSHFEQLFPNVETLKFANLEIHEREEEQLFGQHFWTALKHFSIENIDGENQYMEQIAAFIATNQLEMLSIKHQQNVDKLLALVAESGACSPNLTLQFDLKQPHGMEKVHFDEVKKLIVDNCCEGTLDISIDQLELLALNGEIISQHWIDMIQNVRKVEILMLIGEWENDSVAAQNVDVIKNVPELRELFLSAELTPDQIVDLLTSCASLKFLVFLTPLMGDDAGELKHDSMQKTLETVRDASMANWNMDFLPKITLSSEGEYYGYKFYIPDI